MSIQEGALRTPCSVTKNIYVYTTSMNAEKGIEHDSIENSITYLSR